MPVNLNLLSDEAIARGVTPADVGQGISAFQTGQEYAQKQALQNLFAGGIPIDPATGRPDWSKASEMLLRYGGAPGIGAALQLRSADIQQQALKQNEDLTNLFPPLPGQPSAQPRVQPAPSLSRPPAQSQSYLQPDQGGGEPLQPGKTGNVVEDTEVPGSARMSVDGGPFTALASEPQPAPTIRQFTQNPVPGPAIGRFTPPAEAPEAPVKIAQAGTPQPPANAPARPPITDTNDPGYWTLENARAYDRMAYIFNMRARNLGVGGLAAGVPGERQQGEQAGARANQIYEHLSKLGEEENKARLKERAVLPEAAAKASISRLEKSQEKADTTAQGIAVTQDLVNQLNSKSGIFTGQWATEKLRMARIAEQLGYPINPSQITNTQTFMSVMGQRVAAGVKAFGSGTSITNQDREYVNKMVGGDISLDETSIRRILDITDKLNRGQIQKHNDDVDRTIKAYPNARAQLDPFKVDMPPKIQGRTTGTPSGPPVPGKPWTSSSGKTYEVNPDGSMGRLLSGQ